MTRPARTIEMLRQATYLRAIEPCNPLLARDGTTQGMMQRACLYDLRTKHEATGQLPTNNRFVFYELEGLRLLDKSEGRNKPGVTGRGVDQDIGDAIMHLRDAGLVPWDWIEDETRSLHRWEFATSVAEYVIEAAGYARIDCWAGQPPPLILCESRTFGGVLRRTVASRYLCPIAATNGQVGGFLRTAIAPILQGNDRPILYVGDLDLSGLQIEEKIRDVLVQEAGDREWERIALTEKQAEDHGLEPIMKMDKRTKKTHPAIEVESLGQGVVTQMVVDALDARLPVPLKDVRVREADERKRVAERLEALR